MYRSCGTVAIKNNLLFIVDFSGVVHCLDCKTGDAHWTYDMLSASWGSPMIAEDRVYIGNEYGDVMIFALSDEMELLATNSMETAVYTSPVAVRETLYIANRNHIYALREGAKSEVDE